MTGRKPGSWRGKALLAVLGPLVVFGALEIALRIGGFRYEPWNAADGTYAEVLQERIYAPHPDLLWTLRPSTVLDHPGNGFTRIPSNSLGLRGRELPGPKQPGELRVLCLGDSVTFGLGLEEGATWPDRMEQALRAAPEMAGRTVHVINGAVPGWSSVQGLRLLRQLLPLEPDVIVFWFGMNDASPVRGVPDSAQRPGADGTPGAISTARRLRFVQLAERVVSGLRRAGGEGKRVSRAEFAENVQALLAPARTGGAHVLFVREPERCDVTIAQLERVVARAEEEGVDLVVGPRPLLNWVLPAPDGVDLTGRRIDVHGRPALAFRPDPAIPGYGSADYERTLGQVRADLATVREQKRSLDATLAGLPEHSLGYVDLFADAHPGEVFADNCHLSAFGARRAGEALARAVLDLVGPR